MIFPKKGKQEKLMGKECTFNGKYYRDYGRKKVHVNMNIFGSYSESIPVKWKVSKCPPTKGWIVGFGFCFNGSIETDPEGNYFSASKRINYVKVKISPTGKEIKVPAHNLTTNLKAVNKKDILSYANNS